MKKPIIPIVFSTDENFVPYCGVAISSLIQNTSYNYEYEIYVFHTDLSEYLIHRLESLSYLNVNVECVNVSKFIAGINVYSMHHFTEVTFYRILIPDILRKFSRIIYLDCDLIITSDVAELYRLDINNNVFGAIRDYSKSIIVDYVINKFGIKEEEYINAGVLLIDSENFTKYNIKEKCIDLINSGEKYDAADQDVLNIVCRNKIEILTSEWNYQPRFYKETDNDFKPKIIHYVTSEKPWRYPDIPYAKEFWEVARTTEFYHEILFKHIDCDVDTLEINLYKEYGNDLTKEKPPISYVFPYDLVYKDSQVILYGAGTIGEKIFVNKDVNKYCNIVLWVDKQYKQKNEDNMYNENYTLLSSPKEILNAVYNYIVIAVGFEDIVDSIKQDLEALGVPKEKIIWQ
ncbi:MAG: glycosyltransferase family 8 protein [Oscillospiraceae bacterium]|jgi:lipopolysaccharide biosynthesis glycosyltransferase|nr:glycosyltransferase family 8 protein [Oscillospiraceae bacterium]